MRLTKAHFQSFLILFALFATLNLVLVTVNQTFARGVLTAAGTVLGPMTGALSRNFQDCCLKFSIQLIPYFVPFPAIAALSQIRRKPGRAASADRVRLSIWTLCWFGWFFGGIVSFAHALS
jgi:hypothetical protein